MVSLKHRAILQAVLLLVVICLCQGVAYSKNVKPIPASRRNRGDNRNDNTVYAYEDQQSHALAAPFTPDILTVVLVDGRVVGINARTGGVMWSVDSGGPVVSLSQAVTGVPGLPLFPGADGYLYGYFGEPSSQTLQLERLPHSLPRLVETSPSWTDDGSALLGTRGCTLMVLDGRTGEVIRKLGEGKQQIVDDFVVGGESPQSPPSTSAASHIMIAREDWAVRSVRLDSNAELWNATYSRLLRLGGGGSGFDGSPKLTLSLSNTLTAYNAEGFRVWSTKFDTPPVAAFSSYGRGNLLDAPSELDMGAKEDLLPIVSSEPFLERPPPQLVMVGTVQGGAYVLPADHIMRDGRDGLITPYMEGKGSSYLPASPPQPPPPIALGSQANNQADSEHHGHHSSGSLALAPTPSTAVMAVVGSEGGPGVRLTCPPGLHMLSQVGGGQLALPWLPRPPPALPPPSVIYTDETVTVSPHWGMRYLLAIFLAVTLVGLYMVARVVRSHVLPKSEVDQQQSQGPLGAPSLVSRARGTEVTPMKGVDASSMIHDVTAYGSSSRSLANKPSNSPALGPSPSASLNNLNDLGSESQYSTPLTARSALSDDPDSRSPRISSRSPQVGTRSPKISSKSPRMGTRSPQVATKSGNSPSLAAKAITTDSDEDIVPNPLETDFKGIGTPTPSSKSLALLRVEPLMVGRMSVGPRILGHGSGGTTVYEGMLDGRPVAVKRLLKAYADLANRELEVLVMSDEHPNVLRCFAMEEDREFVYLALERCEGTLHELMIRQAGLPLATERIMTLLLDVVSGLAALHTRGVVHRDIKPQNVLITAKGRAKLSDMGLCRTLEGEDSSFQTHLAGGSPGWQAPEQLIVRGGGNARQTRAMDVFSLGVLLAYVAGAGQHPFGVGPERDVAILRGEPPCLEALEEHVELHNLVSAMLSRAPGERPLMSAVIGHPAWWGDEQKLQFLVDVSDRLEGDDRHELPSLFSDLQEISPHCHGPNWGSALSPALLANLGRYRSYNFNNVSGLLRVIRNKRNHFRELPRELQGEMGSIPSGFLWYFTSRFPHLFLDIYFLALRHLSHEHNSPLARAWPGGPLLYRPFAAAHQQALRAKSTGAAAPAATTAAGAAGGKMLLRDCASSDELASGLNLSGSETDLSSSGPEASATHAIPAQRSGSSLDLAPVTSATPTEAATLEGPSGRLWWDSWAGPQKGTSSVNPGTEAAAVSTALPASSYKNALVQLAAGSTQPPGVSAQPPAVLARPPGVLAQMSAVLAQPPGIVFQPPLDQGTSTGYLDLSPPSSPLRDPAAPVISASPSTSVTALGPAVVGHLPSSPPRDPAAPIIHTSPSTSNNAWALGPAIIGSPPSSPLRDPVAPVISASPSTSTRASGQAVVGSPPSSPFRDPDSLNDASASTSAKVVIGYEVDTSAPDEWSVKTFPRRLDATACEFYVKSGHCKFGDACVFDHPEQYAVRLSGLGLPLRPGGVLCAFYLKSGRNCKYGPACKFHHPPLVPIYADSLLANAGPKL